MVYKTEGVLDVSAYPVELLQMDPVHQPAHQVAPGMGDKQDPYVQAADSGPG